MKEAYHFALVGQTESGKTCYLTTLAMRAIGHPGGMTVAWRRDMLGDSGAAATAPPPGRRQNRWLSNVDVSFAKPAGGRSSYDDERTARANGVSWIQAAIAAIEKGDLPKGNPPEKCVLDFEIGCADRGTTPICLVDYSGESINADMKGPARDGILRHFRNCDGLIVVAEAIPDDAPNRATVEARVRMVVDFFVSLHGKDEQRLGTAIAVMLTKWDTISPVNFDDPGSENSDIEAYIAERPLYENLVNAISHMVLQQPDVHPSHERQVGLQRGNARIFASSSFGHSVLEPNGSRKPLLADRRPFCLIDPLLWLADRADAIAIAELAKASHGSQSWLPWNAWNSFRRANRAMERMPRKSEARRQIGGFRTAAFGKLAAAVALIVTLGDMSRYASVRRDVESRRTAVRNGRFTPDEIASARDYGLAVAASPWNGLLPAVIPWFEPDGHGLASQATDALEKSLGDAVEQAKGTDDVKPLRESLENYLDEKHLPSGKHAGEYRSLLATVIEAERLQVDKNKLTDLKSGIQAIDKSECVTRLTSLSALTAAAVQWPGKMQDEAASIRAQLEKRYGDILKDEKDRELAAKIDEAIQLNNYLAAVDVVVAHSDKNEDWEQKAADLPNRILESCKARTRLLASRLNPQSFAEATVTGEAAQIALRQGDDIPPRFKIPRDAFQTALPSLNAMLVDVVKKPYDQYLYQQICDRKNELTCSEYLSSAPLKSMERTVRHYATILKEQSSPRTITVAAHIQWGELQWDGSPGFDIDQLVTINREPKIVAHLDANPTKGNQEVFGRFTLNVVNADERLDVAIRFTEDDWPGEDDDVGKWSGPFSPLEMQNKREISVNGTALMSPHRIWFTVEGNAYPAQPPLPAWSERP